MESLGDREEAGAADSVGINRETPVNWLRGVPAFSSQWLTQLIAQLVPLHQCRERGKERGGVGNHCTSGEL